MHKQLEQYQAIFFDAGDTLMTIPAAQAIIQQFLALRSLHREEQQIGELFNQAFREFYYGKELNPEELCSPESDKEFWTKLYRFILDELGAHTEWSEDEIHHCCHELYELFTGPEHYRLFDDVPECLEELRQRGLRLGVISNFAPSLRKILDSKGILHFFEQVVVSTEVGLEKPNPAIFRLALAQARLLPSQALYIGDHDQNDIWAPAQVGMDAVKILRYDYLTGTGIHSLRELLK